MINDSERREIAARLRELDFHDFYNAADEVDALETAIGCCIGQDWQDQAWWNRLADLIEPEQERTCKVKQSYFDSDNELNEIMEGIAFSPEDTVACICEACGHDWRYDRGIRPNYCPQCGAKVIDNE